MTHFHIEVDLTCPSNWKHEDVRKFVGKILTGQEHESLFIQQRYDDAVGIARAAPTPDPFAELKEQGANLREAIVYLARLVDGLMSSSQGGPGIDRDVIEMLKVGE